MHVYACMWRCMHAGMHAGMRGCEAVRLLLLPPRPRPRPLFLVGLLCDLFQGFLKAASCMGCVRTSRRRVRPRPHACMHVRDVASSAGRIPCDASHPQRILSPLVGILRGDADRYLRGPEASYPQRISRACPACMNRHSALRGIHFFPLGLLRTDQAASHADALLCLFHTLPGFPAWPPMSPKRWPPVSGRRAGRHIGIGL